MKYAHILPFIKHLEEGKKVSVPPLYIIACFDPSTRRYCQEMAVSTLSGEVVSLDQPALSSLREELSSTSLFAREKIVVATFSDTVPKDVAGFLEGYFEKIEEGVSLLLVMRKLAANTNLFKKGEKAGVIFQQAELKPWEKEKALLEWIKWKAMSERIHIGDQVAMDVIRRSSGDLLLLTSEWDKLITYIDGKKQITPQDVEAICPKSAHETLWQLGQASVEGKGALASKIAKQLLDQNTALIAIIRHLRLHFQNLYQVKCLLDLGRNPHEITEDVPYLRGRQVDALVMGVKNVPAIGKKIALLDQMEGRAKTSGVNEAELLDLLLFSLHE